MYTDKAYLVKDRFREDATQGSLSTFYRQQGLDEESRIDVDVYPASFGVQASPSCPIGLEPLHNLNKMYLLKNVEALESDTFGVYRAELINEDGNRIFLFSEILSRGSDEVIRYGNKYGGKKVKGKVCVGVVNYAGIQVFEVYGDPEKVGPVSSSFGHAENNFLYKKSFDLKIYAKDVLEEDVKTFSERNRDSVDGPIGRFCSAEMHEQLQCYLPMLEVTQSMDIYDKITLIGAFFFFSTKV